MLTRNYARLECCYSDYRSLIFGENDDWEKALPEDIKLLIDEAKIHLASVIGIAKQLCEKFYDGFTSED